jgi:hypothetical protein
VAITHLTIIGNKQISPRFTLVECFVPEWWLEDFPRAPQVKYKEE